MTEILNLSFVTISFTADGRGKDDVLFLESLSPLSLYLIGTRRDSDSGATISKM